MELENDKQERFCREYLIDLNGSAAAKRAGYSSRSAAAIAFELLRKPHISARIAELKAPIMARLDLSAERVLAEYATIAFATMGDFLDVAPDGAFRIDLSRATPDQLVAVAAVSIKTRRTGGKAGAERISETVRIRMAPKLAALVKLGEYLRLFDENREGSDAMAATLSEINRRGSFGADC
jgi:phage terminase small subunit